MLLVAVYYLLWSRTHLLAEHATPLTPHVRSQRRFQGAELVTVIGRSPFSHLSHPYLNLTLTLTNPYLISNPTLTLTLRRVTDVRKWSNN